MFATSEGLQEHYKLAHPGAQIAVKRTAGEPSRSSKRRRT